MSLVYSISSTNIPNLDIPDRAIENGPDTSFICLNTSPDYTALIESGGGEITGIDNQVFKTVPLPFSINQNNAAVQICPVTGKIYIYVRFANYMSLYSSVDGFRTSTSIGTESGAITYADMVCDENGVVHLTWISPAGTELRYANSNNWATVTNICTDGAHYTCKIASDISSPSVVYVAWAGKKAADSFIRPYLSNNSNWTTHTALDDDTISISLAGMALAVDNSGNTRVVWSRTDGGTYWDLYEKVNAAARSLITASTYHNNAPRLSVEVIDAASDNFILIWQSYFPALSSDARVNYAKAVGTAALGSPSIILATAGYNYKIYGTPRKWLTNTSHYANFAYVRENSTSFVGDQFKILTDETFVSYGYNAANTFTNTFTCNVIDTTPPAVASAISVYGNAPKGGDTSITLYVAFTETNPNTNVFAVSLDNWATQTSTTGEAGTATPIPASCSIGSTVNGSSRIYYKCTHTDDYGWTVSSTGDTYVKPRQPSSPTVARNGATPTTALDITPRDNSIDATAIAPSVFSHKIHIAGGATNGWIQADGSVAAGTIWQTVAAWGTKTVSGLAVNTQYTVYSVTRNINNSATESANGQSTSIYTASLAPVIDNVYVFPGSWDVQALEDIASIDGYAYFGGYHYITSYDATDGGIWRSLDFVTWDKIKTGQHREIIEFGSYLYVHYLNGSSLSDIIRSSDGTNWVTAESFVASDTPIHAFGVHGTTLFVAATGPTNTARVYYTTDGLAYTLCNNDPVAQVANGAYFSSFLSTGGVLYAIMTNVITYMANSFQYNAGTNTFDLLNPISCHLTCRAGFSLIKFSVNNKYYIGTNGVGCISESANAVAWTSKKTFSTETPACDVVNYLYEFDGILYAAVYHSSNSIAQIWKSTDGATWTLYVDLSTAGVTKINFIRFIDDILYIGTTGYGVLKNTTGNKKYTILYRVYDPDSTTLTTKTELDVDGAGTYISPTSTEGDVGNITVTTSARYKRITWNALDNLNDTETSNNDIKITVTDPTDQTDDATSANFNLDTKLPAFASGTTLTASTIADTSVVLTWSNAVVEGTHDTYEIYYSTIAENVVTNKGGTRWDNDDDATLATKATVTTTITGLTHNTLYYFALFAIDATKNYSTPAITTSATTQPATVMTGYVKTDDKHFIGSATVAVYRKDTGAFISSTTSSAAGYFSLSFCSAATEFYLVGYKASMQSAIVDNLAGTISGETATEDYDLIVSAQSYQYPTGDVTVAIGQDIGTLPIALTKSTSDLSFSKTRGTIEISKTKADIAVTIRLKEIAKTYTMTFK